ncbi:hypothetical protein JCM10213_003789 [Rhodosporidiobolus nylandii]
MYLPSLLALLALGSSAVAAPAPTLEVRQSSRLTFADRKALAASSSSAAAAAASSSSAAAAAAQSSKTRPVWRAAPYSSVTLNVGGTSSTTARTTTTSARTTTTTATPTTSTSITRAVSSTAFSSSTVKTTTAASTTSAAPRPTSTKKGTGYNDINLSSQLALSWRYNWAQYPDGPWNSSVEFVPMLWNDVAGNWFANAQNAIDNGSKHLLGFNEPDLDSQANMNVTQAVAGWKKYMSPFYSKASLGSPAVTNGGAPMGIAWLQAFAQACPECWAEIDFVALHWYDAAWNTGYFTIYLTDAYHTLGKPIWLTEFAGYGTQDEQIAFLKYVIPWMEQQPFIERYAGFGDFVGTYVNADGSLTPLGQAYSDTM